jgi:ribose 5-phosphate isomerase A
MEDGKVLAAKAALAFVKDGMGIGLGSGSTAAEFIRLLGARAKSRRWKLSCVPTSEDSRLLALAAGLRVCALDEAGALDVTVDGADAVDPGLGLVKGGGACLAREKIAAYAAKKFVCIVDESKLKPSLSAVPVPVEAIPFGCARVKATLEKAWKASVRLRKGSGKLGPVITDNGNYVLDAAFGRIPDPARLERELNCIPGVLENGVFAARKPIVIVGGKGKAYRLR